MPSPAYPKTVSSVCLASVGSPLSRSSPFRYSLNMALRQDVLLSNATIEITNLTLTGVLHSVNLKVERGSMCVLLGVPGSGKTSLIRSILGTVQPTSGSVRVYDQLVHFSPTFVPSAGIGYLPQDATLLGEGVSQFLTIEETLTYFGRFSLSNRALTQRTLFLTDLLNLPKGDRFVGHLNRDDHRLVALATALIHKPNLLLLDDPLFGLSSRLRQSIWKLLVELSQEEQVTVFISSCYITEAEEATHVAMLSNGQISYGKAGQVTTPKASPTATTLNYAIVEHGGSAAKVMDARGVNEPPAASQGMSHAEGQSTEAAPTRTETAPFNWLPFISFITVGVILFYRRFSPTLP